MNIRALKYFITLADLRHFSKAAEACFVSQPTLSTQIKKLEDELGVQLVERAPRQVMLTPIGEEVALRARSVLRDIDQIKSLAQRSKDPSAGSLKIGIFPTLAPYLLPHVIPVIRQQFPKLKLQLIEEKTEQILTMLRQGRLDAALMALPVEDDSLRSTILFEEPFVLAAAQGHPMTREKAVDVEALKGQELLLLEDGHCLRDHALEVCALAGAHERVDFHATSMETLRQMVAADVGITLMPALATKPPIAKTRNLTYTRFADPVPKRTIGMFWRKSSALDEFLVQLTPLFQQIPSQLLHTD